MKMTVRQLNNLVSEYPDNREYHSDKEITIAAIERNPSLITYADDALKDDKEVAYAAVKRGGQTLRALSERLRADKEIVLAAVTGFCQSYEFALSPAKEDPEVIATVARSGRETIALLPKESLGDATLAALAVRRNPKSVKYFSESVKSDKDIALLVIKTDRTAIIYLGDEVFEDKEVFESATRCDEKRVASNTISNDTPLGIFKGAAERNVKINLAAQNMDLLTIDRDKFCLLLDCFEGVFPKKGELMHRFIAEDDKEIVDRLLKLETISPARAMTEIKFARANGKLRVMPLLLAYTKNSGFSETVVSEREKLVKGLKRKSSIALKSLIENIGEYLADREVLYLASMADGWIITYMNESPCLNDEEIKENCFKNYVVKNSRPPILTGLTNLRLTEKQAAFICKRDGRNYFLLSEEFKANGEIAAEAARLNDEVYNSLPEELKNHPTVLKKRL
ncbi:MAG: DUF4116 domain-containing protein [Clostridia bacterium]|nr:DUF4116 domain-containing protein [Clostridia bacterium]